MEVAVVRRARYGSAPRACSATALFRRRAGAEAQRALVPVHALRHLRQEQAVAAVRVQARQRRLQVRVQRALRVQRVQRDPHSVYCVYSVACARAPDYPRLP